LIVMLSSPSNMEQSSTDQTLREPLMNSAEEEPIGGDAVIARQDEGSPIETLASRISSESQNGLRRQHLANNKDRDTGTLPLHKSDNEKNQPIPFVIVRLMLALGQLVWPLFITIVIPDNDSEPPLTWAVLGNTGLVVLLIYKRHEYQAFEQKNSGENDVASGKLHYKTNLHFIDAAPSLCWLAYGIAFISENRGNDESWTNLTIVFWGVLFFYSLYSLIFRKGSPVRKLFQQMEAEHFDHLRDTQPVRDAQLERQLKQLAYLEETAAARRANLSNGGGNSAASFVRTHCSPKQQWLALGLVVLLLWVGYATTTHNVFGSQVLFQIKQGGETSPPQSDGVEEEKEAQGQKELPYVWVPYVQNRSELVAATKE